MTPSTTPRPHARPRRVKRGVVAAYIHDISPRHRSAGTPITPARRVARAAVAAAAPAAAAAR